MNWTCFFLGHKRKVVRQIDEVLSETICTRCEMELAYNARTKLEVQLTDHIRDMHNMVLKGKKKQEVKNLYKPKPGKKQQTR